METQEVAQFVPDLDLYDDDGDDVDELDIIEELRELADSGADDRTCYFIGGDEGPVKIGYAKNPKNRLQELRCAHWTELRILATATGGIYRERYYHIIFENWRMRGEWFGRCPEIEAEIERLNPFTPPPKGTANVRDPRA